MTTCQKCRMDLPDVDWFCPKCWVEDSVGLHDSPHIPLINMVVVGGDREKSKADNLNVVGSTAGQDKILKTGREPVVERGDTCPVTNNLHKHEKVVKG